ncbi:MAG: hypothetical protein FJ388_19600, partial [Verrucomicrobia bacterium]|nr:hypothetical protein [Verrucomicrobiota bacterium]
MKNGVSIWLAAVLSCAAEPQLRVTNQHVGLEFVAGTNTFRLARLYGVATGQNFLSPDSAASKRGLWQLVLRRERGRDTKEVVVNSNAGATVAHRVERNRLRLQWTGVAVAGETNALDVEVTVTLREDDPLTRWRISVTNRSRSWGLWNVIFPVLELAPLGRDPSDNFLALGRARGIVVRDPFRPPDGKVAFGMMSASGAYWPGTFNMQFQALYDQAGAGLYLATHDGGGYKKSFYIMPQSGGRVLEYKVGHYPANMGWPAENYRLNYDVCVGPFRGDWFDACQLYRAWALKQPWCARGPMATRRDVPRWYKESPLALYLMNYHGEGQVPELRDRMLDWLRAIRMDLPLTWYVWKKHFPEITDYNKPGSKWKVPDARPYPCGNIHDGNYPRLPALPNFAEACRDSRSAGGHVQAYVCAQLYDPGLNENAPYAAQAKPNAVRDIQGKIPGEAGDVSWTMCGRTKWWQQRLAET